MLESMAGLDNGVRERAHGYTRPLTGAYYFIPSTRGTTQPDRAGIGRSPPRRPPETTRAFVANRPF